MPEISKIAEIGLRSQYIKEEEERKKKAEARNLQYERWHKGLMESAHQDDCQIVHEISFRQKNGMKVLRHKCYNKSAKHGGLHCCFCGHDFGKGTYAVQRSN